MRYNGSKTILHANYWPYLLVTYEQSILNYTIRVFWHLDYLHTYIFLDVSKWMAWWSGRYFNYHIVLLLLSCSLLPNPYKIICLCGLERFSLLGFTAPPKYVFLRLFEVSALPCGLFIGHHITKYSWYPGLECVWVLGLRTRKACPNYEAVWSRTDVLF